MIEILFWVFILALLSVIIVWQAIEISILQTELKAVWQEYSREIDRN